MEPTAAGNLLEIMDLARTLRQEQLFIQQEQTAFGQLTGALETNAGTITKLAFVCAQQRQILNELLVARNDHDPLLSCRRARAYDSAQFMDAKQVLPYEHALAYEFTNLLNLHGEKKHELRMACFFDEKKKKCSTDFSFNIFSQKVAEVLRRSCLRRRYGRGGRL
ncbi:receptor-mediated endocytosis protein 6 homolog [Drosophila miranda]|uniref:receptor-mediated endocytosis protein 6 homolog n=1 Tax=Drosophila miranda TaxID=7229 RepID=UPI00143F6DC2|nr:receptor-mediated endocytosis protein 6 homolog [Drosophila miranda]XP_033246012.1 receptor-mediated endocytosis protein 6 homolog [Drosophila miranda]XP_033246015.1 receptor-mediated endocytosis protein 6 homolog [Drosophila miranda]XP_033246020.1 receptor-mediated endocytosis protein 6 homolog [Drosophila miranda]